MAKQKNSKKSKFKVSTKKLRRKVNPSIFKFKTTEELSDLEKIIGQERAVKAMDFGLGMESSGYHLYVLGPPSIGKAEIVRDYLERKAKEEQTPKDWLYINNFEKPRKPKKIGLPAGKGRELEKDMDDLVESLEEKVPEVFESEEYQKEKEKIDRRFEKRREEELEELQEEAKEAGFKLVSSIQGLALMPTKDGEIVPPEKLKNLSKEEKAEIENRKEAIKDEVEEAREDIQRLQEEKREELKEVNKKVLSFSITPLIERLEEKYSDFPVVVEFLGAVKEDILNKTQKLKRARDVQKAKQKNPLLQRLLRGGISFDQYRVNLIVDNSETEGAPVVCETSPSYPNLIGRIEHKARLGALVTNFRNIRSGSLHKANGGYLIVEVKDLLTKPFAWESLKRVLKDKEIKIEKKGLSFRAFVTKTLEPEPIALDVKVVLLGSPMIYYLLYALDNEFQRLFKAKVDFSLESDWSKKTAKKYAQFIRNVCKGEELNHFTPEGAAKLVEQASRMAGHQGKLSTKFAEIKDLIREAHFYSQEEGKKKVEAEDVQKAIEEKIYRSNRLEEKIQEMIEEGTLLIDTEGEKTGQVNGISIIPLGDYMFGKPSRITARSYVGKKGVVNIDREAELGGKVHNKGVMILDGYLGGRYAREVPLALSARITFEQLYEEVEGDSASSAELFALLSSIADLPLKQNLAITGSVNQQGEIQAIGGVNQKIEGFYKVCKKKGFSGDQGVIIPKSNVKHLMLKEEVVQSVEKGEFHIYAIENIDQGMEILTGKKAGKRKKDGSFPKNSINWKIENNLKELANKVKDFSRKEKED